jgi:hypothetical protein
MRVYSRLWWEILSQIRGGRSRVGSWVGSVVEIPSSDPQWRLSDHLLKKPR